MTGQPDLFESQGVEERPFEIPAWLRRQDIGASLPPIRIMANGHDVTDRMPLTRARLERMRAEELGKT